LSFAVLTACALPQPPVANNTTSASGIEARPAQTGGADEIADGPLPVREQSVAYYGAVSGYVAEPRESGKYPGIILIHEWWGLNENIKQTARKLASNGYRVLAVDLYNGKVAADADNAMKLVQAVDATDATKNLRAAATYLRDAGSTNIGSWGYCFGGGQSMNLALSGEQLAATIVYYGDVRAALSNPSAVKNPVLFIYGDQDQNTPASAAQQLKTQLDARGVGTELYIYKGVGHAFANPSNPNHNVQDTQDAWTKSLAFLQKNLH
jgi:carboxymethylenebutenolidase